MSEDRSTNGSESLTWLERISQVLTGGEPKDKADLLELLRDAQQRNLMGLDALVMIEGVLQVSEMQVRDIMIPRSQMVAVEQGAALGDVLPVIAESGHSRFPVVGDDRNEVIGLLLAKDLLPYFIDGQQETFNVRDVLRPAVFVPESMRLNVLLKDFRTNRNHMAIVLDEFGGAAGLVTIEDVVEQIVGEIADEHDIEEDIFIKKQSDDCFIIKALTPIEEFNEYFKSDFSDEEFDTIGGLVIQGFGHMPERGEEIEIGQYHVKVLSADSRRVHLLEVRLLKRREKDPQSSLQEQAAE